MKLDKRRKYYLILDCETATLPIAEKWAGCPETKKKIAIAKPLIYDLGWQIVDGAGRVYDKRSFLIAEIFSVPSIFNTAYYKGKRPQYLEKMQKGEIVLTDWNTAINALLEVLPLVDSVGAYNAGFDFKKAIPFTERYIYHLYNSDFFEWEQKQNELCERLASGERLATPNGKKDDPTIFNFRGQAYPLFDIWGLACKILLNTDEFRETAKEKQWYSKSGAFYSSTAETVYRYISGNTDFDERHTALEDAEIETEIFMKILAKTKKKVEYGLTYFPFRIIGMVSILDRM